MSTTSPGSQSQGENRKDRISTLTPISISQVHNATSLGDGFGLYENQGLGQVSLVGIIRDVDKKATKTTYTIEDHTGTVEVTRWADKDGDDDTESASDCRENMYVEVIGQIKEFNDKRSISAFTVRPIEANEITAHLLSTIFSYLRHTKGVVNDQGQLIRPGEAMMPAQTRPMQTDVPAGMMGAGMNQYTAQQTTAVQQGVEGGNDIQQAVMNVVKQYDNDEGVSVQSIGTQLRSKYTEQQVRDALEWLSGEGHVYSTIDDDHFKSTDS